MSSSRAGAASVAGSASRCVVPASRGSCGVVHRAANAVGRRGRGLCAAAPSAAAGGSHLQVPGPHSCTRTEHAPLWRRGRSAGDATWQPSQPISSRRPFQGRPEMSFRSFRVTETGGSYEVMPPLLRLRQSFLLPGRSHWLHCCSVGRVSVASATCRGPNVAGTWRGCSPREAHPLVESVSSMTSTRPDRRRQHARRHSVEWEPNRSTSCASRGPCASG